MPKYELMYILASGVSDDQVPGATANVTKAITEFGGTNITESQLGKKKLAYPIRRTRNGHYIVTSFDMDSSKINLLDSKIRTQTSTVIRYLIVNLDEHLKRKAKDEIVRSQIPHLMKQEAEAAEALKAAEAAEEQATKKTAPKKEKETVKTDAPAAPTEEVKVEEVTESKPAKASKKTSKTAEIDLDERIEAALSEEIV